MLTLSQKVDECKPLQGGGAGEPQDHQVLQEQGPVRGGLLVVPPDLRRHRGESSCAHSEHFTRRLTSSVGDSVATSTTYSEAAFFIPFLWGLLDGNLEGWWEKPVSTQKQIYANPSMRITQHAETH